jgi:hypothetical protein
MSMQKWWQDGEEQRNPNAVSCLRLRDMNQRLCLRERYLNNLNVSSALLHHVHVLRTDSDCFSNSIMQLVHGVVTVRLR